MTTDLALSQNHGLLMDMQAWNQALAQCTVLVKSGFLPKGIDTPEKAMLVACKAHDLQIGLMTAFDGMAVFNGQICMFGKLALALFRRVKGHIFDVIEHDETVCRAKVGRPGMETREISFTIAEAERAKLLGKDNWKHYPKDMLFWRVVARANKQIFSDITGGMTLHEEMDTIDVEHRDNTGKDDNASKAQAAQNLLTAGAPKVAPPPAPPPAPEVKPERTFEEKVNDMLEAFAKLGIGEDVVLAEMMAADREALREEDLKYLRDWYKREKESRK